MVFRGRFVFFCSDGFDFRVFRAFSWTFNVFFVAFSCFFRVRLAFGIALARLFAKQGRRANKIVSWKTRSFPFTS